MACGKIGAGVHRGQEDVSEALAVARLIEGAHDLAHAVNCPTIVAPLLVGSTKVEVRQGMQDAIPASRGKREGTLGGRNGLVMRAQHAEML
jgi:hypothetical protein